MSSECIFYCDGLPGSEEVAEIVDDPLDSGLGGEPGEARTAAPLTGLTTTASLSGLLRRMEGRGEPGTVLSAVSEAAAGPGMMGVILAGVRLAGPVTEAPELC